MISSGYRSEIKNELKRVKSHLVDSKFISEIVDYKTISLGSAEGYFLSLISLYPQSAYSIFLHLKESPYQRRIKGKLKKGIAYPNVLKRVKRLQELQLIEFENRYSRNEIKYKITSFGLFQLMLNNSLSLEAIIANKEDIILKQLLFQFFEYETITEFDTVLRRSAVRNYLRNCANAIVTKLEDLRNAPYQFSPQEIIKEFAGVIPREIQKLGFLIIVQMEGTAITNDFQHELGYLKKNSIWNDRYWESPDRRARDPKYDNQFPRATLIRDRKFMTVLAELIREFDSGSEFYRTSLPVL